MKGLCLEPGCDQAHHCNGKCHRHNMRDYRSRNRPPGAGRGWNPDQIRSMADILDRDGVSGLGIARPGEILTMARAWGRSQQSVTQALCRMRAERRRGLRRGPGGLKGKPKGPAWTADQLAPIVAILDRDCEGIGAARAGELAMVADRDWPNRRCRAGAAAQAAGATIGRARNGVESRERRRRPRCRDATDSQGATGVEAPKT